MVRGHRAQQSKLGGFKKKLFLRAGTRKPNQSFFEAPLFEPFSGQTTFLAATSRFSKPTLSSPLNLCPSHGALKTLREVLMGTLFDHTLQTSPVHCTSQFLCLTTLPLPFLPCVQLVKTLCEALMGQLYPFITDKFATHVARRLLCLAAGRNVLPAASKAQQASGKVCVCVSHHVRLNGVCWMMSCCRYCSMRRAALPPLRRFHDN